MKFVYVDESGDFGRSKKSTKTVVIAAVFSTAPREISIWLRRIRKRKLDKKARKQSELKAADASDKFLSYFYQHISDELKFNVYAIIIEKNKIPQNLRHQEGIVYLLALEKLVKISQKEIEPVMFWYFDKRTLKKVSWETVRQNLKTKILLLSVSKKPLIEIHAADSQRVLNLQLADFIAYAINRSINQNDNRWTKIIKSHIRQTKTLEP